MDKFNSLEALTAAISNVSAFLFSNEFSLDILQYIQLKRKYIPLPKPPPKPYKHHYTH